MKKLTFLSVLLLFLLALAACTGQPTSPAQPTQPPPTSTLPATATPPLPSVDVPSPTVAAPTQSPTVVAETGNPVILLSTHMTSVDDGWAVGTAAEGALQRILRTADGGQTWRDFTPRDQAAKRGNTDTAVISAYFGEDYAWAMYFSPIPAAASESMYVWRTTDRGQTWVAGDPLEMADLPMEFFIPGEIGFADAQNGWLLAHLGAGMNHDYVAVFKTADGGQTWTLAAGPNDSGDTALPMVCSKTGLTFRDGQSGWVSGNCNGVMAETFLYRTMDGGSSWRLVKLPNPPDQPNLLSSEANVCGTQPPVFVDGQNGALAVDCRANGSAVRSVYLTSDGGETWAPQERSLAGWDRVDFVRSGDSWTIRSSAGGDPMPALFAPLFNQPSSPPALALSGQPGIDFLDSQTGWAVVTVEDGQPHLLRTSDGGRTWQEIQPYLLP